MLCLIISTRLSQPWLFIYLLLPWINEGYKIAFQLLFVILYTILIALNQFWDNYFCFKGQTGIQLRVLEAWYLLKNIGIWVFFFFACIYMHHMHTVSTEDKCLFCAYFLVCFGIFCMIGFIYLYLVCVSDFNF